MIHLRTYRAVELSSDGHKVAGGVVVDQGGPVVASSAGARKARGLPAEPFLGFAEREANNTTGPEGDVRVLVYRRGNVLLEVEGVDESTAPGSVVYSDGTLFSIVPIDGRRTAVGWTRIVVAVGRCWVHFRAFALGGPPNHVASEPTHALGLNVGYHRIWAPGIVHVDLARGAQPWWQQRNGSDYSQNTPASPADADGYPTGMPGEGWWATTMVHNQSSYPGGLYNAIYDGEGTIVFSRDAAVISNNPGVVVLNVTPSEGIFVQLTATNPANHLRNLRILPAA